MNGMISHDSLFKKRQFDRVRVCIAGICVNIHFDVSRKAEIGMILDYTPFAQYPVVQEEENDYNYYIEYLVEARRERLPAKYHEFITLLKKKIVLLYNNPKDCLEDTFKFFFAAYFDAHPQLFEVLLDGVKTEDATVVSSGAVLSFFCKQQRCGFMFRLIIGEADPLEIKVQHLVRVQALYEIFRTSLMAARKGVIMHAASCAREGAGYVFLGKGGDGKSTIVKTLKKYRGLSDDLSIIVTDEQGGFSAVATPWWNEYKQGSMSADMVSRSFPIKYIFFLEKSDVLKATPIDVRDALSRFLFYDQPLQLMAMNADRESNSFYFNMLADIATGIPSYELKFPLKADLSDDFNDLVNKLDHGDR
ncbi:MAG: hypothetical protein JW938_01670 [Candidatus Omnitrophica bacterium]|nr:hypothetical protein [Candidatus Omnitrophota bacterium]